MKHQLRVTTGNSRLHIRSGAGMQYKVTGYLASGSRIVATELKTINGWKWYKHDKGWSCAYRSDWKETYLVFEKDLDPPPPPTPPSPPKPAPPAIDYNKINNLMNDKQDITSANIDLTKFQVRAGTGYESSENLVIPRSMATSNENRTSYETVIDVNTVANLERVKKNLNVMNGSGFSSITAALFNSFDRFKVPFPEYHLAKTYSYVFFTRPDLNIMVNDKLAAQVENDPLYYYLYKNDKNILKSLTSGFSASHDFQTFLSNTAQSFEVSDEFVRTVEHGETLTGFKVQYGTSNIESRTAGTFSISYTDDKNYTIYKIHKAWVEYISRVYRGEFVPRKDYRYKKILDYACSVYYFVCAEDGETILFWTKYFGVFPTNIPASTSSWGKGNLIKTPEYSITYAYAFKEDFTPLTLAEFNVNSKASGTIAYRKIYESVNCATGKTFANAPFIETYTTNGEYVFKLKFRN